MNYSLLRSDARARLKGKWGTAALIVFVFSLLSAAVEGFGFMFDGDAFSLIGSIVFIIVSGPLTYGFYNVFLKINRGKKADVGDLFVGFNEDTGNKINAGVSIYIYTFLWSLLFLIPGIVASYSYSMTYYIMIDNPKLSSKEAITKSKEMMRGHKMQLFMLDLSFIGWIILGILSFGIGLLWVYAYMQAAHARFYEALAGVPSQSEETEDATTTIKNENEVSPYTQSDDADVIYRLKCDKCGAAETHTQKSTTCPYCGGTMHES